MSEKEKPVELKEFINSTLDAIERGADLKHRSISGPVKFEVTVKKTFKGEGGIKVYVVSGSAKSENENIATVKFSISSKSPARGAVVATRKLPPTRLHV
jgi:hypothetical protein